MDQPGQNSVQGEQHNSNSHWWLFWLLVGLAVVFLLILIILRGLCTDVWYIRLLGLNNVLCNETTISGNQPKNMSVLSLNGNELSISGGNSITLPLNVNSQPGPSGANGSKGTPGIAGSTGPTGPSGPTDPCVVAGTYFCQNGNSYGATAQLGTLDNQDLQVVTASTNSLKIDALGNIIPNKLATVGGFGQSSFSGTSDSNFVIPTGGFAPGASTFTNSSANILQTESATIIDSSYNIGWAHNSTLNGTGYNLLYSLGSNITGGYGMVGQFVGATVNGSSNLMGQFGSFGGNLTVTDSSNILGGADGGSSITNSSNAIVGLQGNSTINFGLNSLIRINAGSATNVDTSIIQANNGTLLNLSRVTANGSNINLSGVSDSAFIGSDINITNTTRSAMTGVSVTASDTTNTNATGFVLGLDNVDWSNINGFSTNITDSSWSNIMANGPIAGIATIQNLSHFTGGFQGSVSINGIYGGAGNIVESVVNSSGGLYGGIHLADVNNAMNW
ncbi:MAG: collagen-like protein [Candidatus Saccharibacteria bacterium]